MNSTGVDRTRLEPAPCAGLLRAILSRLCCFVLGWSTFTERETGTEK